MGENNSIHKKVILFLLILSTLSFIQLASGCGNGGPSRNGSTSETALDPLPLTSEGLRGIVVSSLGDANQLREAALTGEGTEKIVDIGIDRPATLEDGSVEAIMAVATQKIMSGLFEYPEVSRVTITMYGVKQGVKSDDVAVRASVTRDAAQEIDWSMLGPMTLSLFVPEYYIDPVILANSDSGISGMHS